MRSKFGIFLIVIGTALVIGALSLFAYNEKENTEAGEASAEVMPLILEEIKVNVHEKTPASPETRPAGTETEPSRPLPNTPVELLTPEQKEMTEYEVAGDSYIGYVLIPSLKIELPIMADISYPNLKKAPCRHAGTVLGEDLVLAGHNYKRHFGPLRRIKIGAEVSFVDMDGYRTEYTVVATDIVAGNEIGEMLNTEFDLAMYTCTLEGDNRILVFCEKVQ